MKLIACYTVFDGLELLLPSMETIAPFVDGFVVCWQQYGHRGGPMSQENRQWLMDNMGFKTVVGKPVQWVEFDPWHHMNAKATEIRKHNMMIDGAKQMGATHFLMAATDHFYNPDEFDYGKWVVEKMDYDSTFTAMYTYYKKPTWQISPIEDYYMPFICKLHPHTRIEKMRMFPLRVDPSVKMNTLGKWYLFKTFEVMMHHYSLVRQDIRGKFMNAASPWSTQQIEDFTNDWEQYDIENNPGIKYFQGRKVVQVRDFFNLGPVFN